MRQDTVLVKRQHCGNSRIRQQNILQPCNADNFPTKSWDYKECLKKKIKNWTGKGLQRAFKTHYWKTKELRQTDRCNINNNIKWQSDQTVKNERNGE